MFEKKSVQLEFVQYFEHGRNQSTTSLTQAEEATHVLAWNKFISPPSKHIIAKVQGKKLQGFFCVRDKHNILILILFSVD